LPVHLDLDYMIFSPSIDSVPRICLN